MELTSHTRSITLSAIPSHLVGRLKQRHGDEQHSGKTSCKSASLYDCQYEREWKQGGGTSSAAWFVVLC
jgi:hypothetical protein